MDKVSSEKIAFIIMQQVVATILQNIGFSNFTKRGLVKLTSVFVAFFQQFIRQSKSYCEHGYFL